MEEKIDYQQIPFAYTLCINSACVDGASCLRLLAMQSMPPDVRDWTILSPTHLAGLKDACPYYRSTEKIRLAQGFVSVLDNLPHKQSNEVAARLMSHFGRRAYYRFRKGERLLSPAEQQEVERICQGCGVSAAIEFDAYLVRYNW